MHVERVRHAFLRLGINTCWVYVVCTKTFSQITTLFLDKIIAEILKAGNRFFFLYYEMLDFRIEFDYLSRCLECYQLVKLYLQ